MNFTSNPDELVIGFTPEEALKHLDGEVRNAKRANFRFMFLLLRRMLHGCFSPVTNTGSPLIHRHVRRKTARIVRIFKRHPELFDPSTTANTRFRRKLSNRCEKLASTMTCIDMDVCWEARVLQNLSELIYKH